METGRQVLICIQEKNQRLDVDIKKETKGK
jgi:hypothetical protein